MKPLSLKCDANPKDYATLTREGACAGLTVQEGRKVALVNLTAPQMREAAAWLNECAAEVEAMRAGVVNLCRPGCRTQSGRVNAAFCPHCVKAHAAEEAMRASHLRLVSSRCPDFIELDLFSGDDYAS